MILDYETLKLVWWVLVGVLLVGFMITDGFDMGAGILLPFLGKNDAERRIIINTVGPHWDGNQVWFITAGGALFAAWPAVYAVAFSSFYFAMMLVLFALFFRPVGFDYRSKIADPRWRSTWDWGLFISGAVPALVFGVAFGNLLLGVDFYLDDFLRPHYTGSFFDLFHPFALICGVVSLSMLAAHGAIWLQMRADQPVADRAGKAGLIMLVIMLIAFAAGGLVLLNGMPGLHIDMMPAKDALPNPLNKQVSVVDNGWLANYQTYSWMIAAPITAFITGLLTLLLVKARRSGLAFATHSITMTAIICTAAFSLFPFVLPSLSNPNSSLTLWDAASSHLTLNVMFIAAMIFVPIILLYTLWTYKVMWGRVTSKQIEGNPLAY
ncbi:cytochrome d ubiquinol oxidase subunit II [Oceanospirillum multiglobuliferum]|uniref:Cytochrome d ubiquinol oxidase subunit II n=1 Tax=Oceanospirillum multiglobuliferum TaxID=64969 RepID=A0A1T4S586_9GAMM|nr:cytochrome d ubiquinol oxidase subunit II [Oceanospirillum multiglobuliferum]OPX54447.1 cytochrome d ubiquinol oxidase subunit II [Oceanospirillum multiglobuliferum]SKA23307.1 cytochrome d ubiquinol oxidase subunit II [Oceanospirillum multiglobuliferum]